MLKKIFYPAVWVYDKGTLGTEISTHLWRNNLPRYQWTFLEGKTRIRFLSWSHRLNQTNGIAFLILVMSWIRNWGIEGETYWQENWGAGIWGR